MDYRIIGGKPILSAEGICRVLRTNGLQLEYLEYTEQRAVARVWFGGQVEAESTVTIEEIAAVKHQQGRELAEPWLTFPGHLLAVTALRSCARQLAERQPNLFIPGGVR